MRESGSPALRRLQVCKASGRTRGPVRGRTEQGFDAGLVITDAWRRIRGLDTKSLVHGQLYAEARPIDLYLLLTTVGLAGRTLHVYVYH